MKRESGGWCGEFQQNGAVMQFCWKEQGYNSGNKRKTALMGILVQELFQQIA